MKVAIVNVGKIRQVAIQYNSHIKVKGKVIPLQDQCGPKGG